MRRAITFPGRRRAQRGIVAIEVTLVCVMLFAMAMSTLVFGQFILEYNVMRAATGQAAHYLSVAPVTSARITFATQMVLDAAADAGLSGVTVTVNCLPSFDCLDTTSTSVHVVTKADFYDPTYTFAPDGAALKAIAVAGYYQDLNK